MEKGKYCCIFIKKQMTGIISLFIIFAFLWYGVSILEGVISAIGFFGKFVGICLGIVLFTMFLFGGCG